MKLGLPFEFQFLFFTFCFWSLQDVEVIWNDNTVSQSIRRYAQLGAMNLMSVHFIMWAVD